MGEGQREETAPPGVQRAPDLPVTGWRWEEGVQVMLAPVSDLRLGCSRREWWGWQDWHRAVPRASHEPLLRALGAVVG